MRNLKRILYPVLFVTTSLMLALFYPLLLLIFYAGAFVLLMLLRQSNLYRTIMMLKQALHNFSKLRCDVRARLHLGFKDYNDLSIDTDRELNNRSHGYIR